MVDEPKFPCPDRAAYWKQKATELEAELEQLRREVDSARERLWETTGIDLPVPGLDAVVGTVVNDINDCDMADHRLRQAAAAVVEASRKPGPRHALDPAIDRLASELEGKGT